MAEGTDKPVKKKRRLYSEESLHQAYEAVMIDDMSIYAASREFGIPERTLSDRCKGRIALDSKPGGSSHLTPEEEKKLCEHMKQLFFEGNVMNYTFMRRVATDFIRELDKKTLKPGVIVTKKWLSAYLKRWPDFKKMLHSKAVVKIELNNDVEESDEEPDQVESSQPDLEEEVKELAERSSVIEEKPESETDTAEPQPLQSLTVEALETVVNENPNISPLPSEDNVGIGTSKDVNSAAQVVVKNPSPGASKIYRASIIRKTLLRAKEAVENNQNTVSSDALTGDRATQSSTTPPHDPESSYNKVAQSPSQNLLSNDIASTSGTGVSQHHKNVTLVLNQEKKKKRNYPPDAMFQAVDAVKNQGMKVYKAADIFGVPEKTLAQRISGKVSVDAKSGPKFYLTHDEELKLCNYFIDQLKNGECPTHTAMRDIATQYMQELDVKRKSESKLTMQWLTNFLKRWPDLDELLKEKLALKEVSKKMNSMYIYYGELGSLLNDYGLDDSPHQIYMIEEIEIPQVLSNFKPVTVLAGASAAGHIIPPYIVYRSLNGNSDMIEGIPENAKIALEQAEVTKFDRLHAYLEAHFIYNLNERDVNKPLLVFYDSHKNNLPGKITEWANDNNVFFNGYPPIDVKHFTYVDCKLLGLFEWKFREACVKFSQMTRQKVTKKQISALTCNAYEQALLPENVQLVFSSAGLYPFYCPLESKEEIQLAPDIIIG